jgi:transcriptional regulator with XRE-family HTH domain
MAGVPDTISVSQLVAYNLGRIRKALGLTQDQAAVRLEPYLGVRWSKAVYSAAERSYKGTRVRQFTAAELAAFSMAFGVPVAYFFLPPKPEDRSAGAVAVGGKDLAWPELFEITIGGQHRSAVQPRIDELPIPEQPGNAHDLAAAGIKTLTGHLRARDRGSLWPAFP